VKPQRTLVTASAEAETSAAPVKQERRGSIRTELLFSSPTERRAVGLHTNACCYIDPSSLERNPGIKKSPRLYRRFVPANQSTTCWTVASSGCRPLAHGAMPFSSGNLAISAGNEATLDTSFVIVDGVHQRAIVSVGFSRHPC